MPWSFWILALFTLIAAGAAMSLRNLIHCALCLALAFIGMAGMFLHLTAPFLAFAQILVYVGAVAILIVFATLLTRNSDTSHEARATRPVLTIPLAALVAAVLLSAIGGSALPSHVHDPAAPTVLQIGSALMTTHVLPLELIGLLLTVALLGAVIIALPEKGPLESEAKE